MSSTVVLVLVFLLVPAYLVRHASPVVTAWTRFALSSVLRLMVWLVGGFLLNPSSDSRRRQRGTERFIPRYRRR